MSQIGQLVEAIERGKGAKFGSFRYRSKGTGELAQVLVILGADTSKLYQKDVDVLIGLQESGTLEGLEVAACAALLKSRVESLTVGIGFNSAYVHGPDAANTYIPVLGSDKGLFIHRETGELYIHGLAEHKTVIEPGEYKVVNSRPLTLAKKKIAALLPSNRFRQYILRNVVGAKVNGDVIEFEIA